MSDFLPLTLVRYPPRNLPGRANGHGMRVAAARGAAAALALAWLPAVHHVAAGAAAGAMQWPADLDSWVVLAGLAPAGLPLALACGGMWRRGHGVAAWAVAAVLVPAVAAGSVAVDLLGPVAVAACAVAASLPAWLLFVYLRLFRQAPRRAQRRRGARVYTPRSRAGTHPQVASNRDIAGLTGIYRDTKR